MQYTELHCKSNFSFLEGAGFGERFLEGRLLFEGAGDAASNSLRF